MRTMKLNNWKRLAILSIIFLLILCLIIVAYEERFLLDYNWIPWLICALWIFSILFWTSFLWFLIFWIKKNWIKITLYLTIFSLAISWLFFYLMSNCYYEFWREKPLLWGYWFAWKSLSILFFIISAISFTALLVNLTKKSTKWNT